MYAMMHFLYHYAEMISNILNIITSFSVDSDYFINKILKCMKISNLTSCLVQ